MAVVRRPSTAIHIQGWEDMNPRWVCWAVSQGLDPRSAGEESRKHPARYEIFSVWIMQHWREFDARCGYPRDWIHSETDHKSFTRWLVSQLGLCVIESHYEIEERDIARNADLIARENHQ